MDLFEYQSKKAADAVRPLAERMRPGSLDDFVGQSHITGKGKIVRMAIETGKIFSMILWGPPGCGKTTLAGIIARGADAYFVQFSAVLSGVKDIRSVIAEAKNQQILHKRKTILFVDEIHRFNKAQQDAFLPHVENGLITLIGATTENPSFEVISALLSRCRVLTLNPLSSDEIGTILKYAATDKTRGLGNMNLTISKKAFDCLIRFAYGDARNALNSLETVAALVAPDPNLKLKNRDSIPINVSDIENALQQKALLYDKSGEEHYNLISAFHKSMRGSDPDASLYWLGRMIGAGEDPLFIARRMVRFATEDIGNADPNALTITMNAMDAFRFLGSPEGELALAQAVVYLATAPKSNSIYSAYKRVQSVVSDSGSLPVPLHIRNAPTKLMEKLDYGKGYKYAHDYKNGYVSQEYLPDRLIGKRFYFPSDRGFEKIIGKRLAWWDKIKRNEKD